MLAGKSPFLFIILAVIALVVMLNMGTSVITTTDTILTTASSGGRFGLTGTVFQFVPPVWITAALGVSALVGYVGGVTRTTDLTQQIILSAIAILIGISATSSILTSAQSMYSAAVNATNASSLTLTLTVIPFVPVIYAAGLLAIAGMPWLSRIRGMRG